jgi:hypothetical protein
MSADLRRLQMESTEVSDCCACGPFVGNRKLVFDCDRNLSKPPPNVGNFLCEDQASPDLHSCT